MSLSSALLDNPLLLSILFHPRSDEPGQHSSPNVYDGVIPVEDRVALGYRLYAHPARAPVVVYFHGNGEIASDHDTIAPMYHHAGASLLVVDYRGYGWSTGQPRLSTLLSDTEFVRAALPDILKAANLTDQQLFLMGRSLGSACAIHMAHQHPELFKGLIIESGFAHAIDLIERLGLPVRMLHLPDPIGNDTKIKAVRLPLLVIHGELDNLIPISEGEALYHESPAALKQMAWIPHAGHNDLLYHGIDQYFGAIADFIKAALK
jgi:hypothetical protein